LEINDAVAVCKDERNATWPSSFLKRRFMAKPNRPLLDDAVRKFAPFLDEIVFVGGITLGLLITAQRSRLSRDMPRT
jgi:hypothetical protein